MSAICGRIGTVLAVDSDEDSLCLLKSILRLKGFDVLEAVNGQEAIDLAVRSRPELIVMELKLPLVHGFTVIRRIRKLERFSDVPIVSFSPKEPTCHRSLALAAGCAAHLDKPIDFLELEALLDQLLPGHRVEFKSNLVH